MNSHYFYFRLCLLDSMKLSMTTYFFLIQPYKPSHANGIFDIHNIGFNVFSFCLFPPRMDFKFLRNTFLTYPLLPLAYETFILWMPIEAKLLFYFSTQ